MTLKLVEDLTSAQHLVVLGGFACDGDPTLPAGTRSLLLLGPAWDFWAHLQTQPEWNQPDRVDRWSRRVIGRLAGELDATALFPFGGPPWKPFHQWALRTGQIWDSPVRLLVHADQGLMVSFRGALALRQHITLPEPPAKPCDSCAQPCRNACPVSALTPQGYDTAACHAFLDTAAGTDCMNSGCAVRRTCPLSIGHARMQNQSAYHMRQFHR